MSMNDLYQEIILDHARSPRHVGLRDPFDAQAHHVNTTCGDEVTLRVTLDRGATTAEPTVRDISYESLGCSISQASTSVLTELLIGCTVSDALAVLNEFHTMVMSKGTVAGDEDILGDAVAFAGVAQYPNRVKCALLGWKAFEDATAQAQNAASQNGAA